MTDAAPPRVVFFGSPDFAVPTLRLLLESRVAAGRGRDTAGSAGGSGAQAAASAGGGASASEAGVAVLQPSRLRDPEALAALAELEPELQIVTAYGQLLPPPVLDAPRFGTLNVHASLLPRWRGAAPVSAAILAGDGADRRDDHAGRRDRGHGADSGPAEDADRRYARRPAS